MENIDQMGMNMKVWQNPYNFAHKYSGQMNDKSSKAVLGYGCNKYTLDIMDQNILRCL